MMMDLRVMTQRSTDQTPSGDSQDSTDSKNFLRESLSALVDGEASDMEVRRLLKQAGSDSEIRESWRRYHLVRALLKSDPDINPHVDLSQRISAAIEQEDSLQARGRLKQWTGKVGKVAIAASVTCAFILGVQQFAPQGQQAPAQMAAASESPLAEQVGLPDRVPTGFELPPFAARTVSTDAATRKNTLPLRDSSASYEARLQHNRALQNHFDQLLLRHAERSSSNGSMGLIPFARISRLDAVRE